MLSCSSRGEGSQRAPACSVGTCRKVTDESAAAARKTATCALLCHVEPARSARVELAAKVQACAAGLSAGAACCAAEEPRHAGGHRTAANSASKTWKGTPEGSAPAGRQRPEHLLPGHHLVCAVLLLPAVQALVHASPVIPLPAHLQPLSQLPPSCVLRTPRRAGQCLGHAHGGRGAWLADQATGSSVVTCLAPATPRLPLSAGGD